MEPPSAIIELIERFERNRKAYLSGVYNETQLRREFVDPLFETLGWDMFNKLGYAEPYKDVIHEDAIKVGGFTKAPDYCFRIGGTRKFFVEAKKPSVNIREDVSPAFQLRRYAWSAKLPLSILTDFEELAVYDCRVKPVKTDKAASARTLYVTYEQYPERWDDIATVFSRDAILKGSFDKYVETTKGKKGTAEVDDAFLKEIESWRDSLARNIALRNPGLTQRDMNFAVQTMIDRIIFLRMCEDRGIEEYGRLLALMNGTNIYSRMFELFQRADERYNSGLFHFRDEKDRHESPDLLTPALALDDKPLKEIIRNLYYPESPYEFAVLPADILGHVYEQFLGKVIRLTAGHRAVVEDKPEVKKAGGVYYTPTYIVDYIVENTVGKLLEGRTPKQIAKIRILDPACGSGSFLIGAFQYLLDWHRDWLVEDGVEKHTKEIYEGPGGEWRLTTAERKRILLNNIYGVDIDPQAVEVTKLSLLLKVLEGESDETISKQLKLFHERALPDLSENIKCGNSLIGPDFYDNQQMTLLDDEERYRINAFNWNTEFAEVMEAGGFNTVIGNPPYVFTRSQGIDESQKSYFYSLYHHQSAQLNTFGMFIERCHALLCKSGVLGFITPNNWLTIDSFTPLRQFIVSNSSGVQIVNIIDRVFTAANVDTAIVLFKKGSPTSISIKEMKERKEIFSRQVDISTVRPPAYIIQISLLKDPESQKVLDKVALCSRPLSHYCTVSTGLKAYQTGKGKPPQGEHEKKGRVFHSTCKVDDTYRRYLNGFDVRRYNLVWSGQYLSYGEWLAEPRESVPFNGERLLVRQIPSKPPYLINAVFTDREFYNDINSMVIFSPAEGISLKYLLGLMNSRLLSVWFQKTYDKLQRNIFPQFKVKELSLFPIRELDTSNSSDKVKYDQLVNLVEQMLKLHVQLNKARTPNDKTTLQRQIEATDRQIDQLVYELYELTDDEIEIVEEALK
jgi:hypothetical protein